MDKKIQETKEFQVKHVADIIGEWGNWQRALFIYASILGIFAALNNIGYTFHAFQVDFWCEDVPEDYKV